MYVQSKCCTQQHAAGLAVISCCTADKPHRQAACAPVLARLASKPADWTASRQLRGPVTAGSYVMSAVLVARVTLTDTTPGTCTRSKQVFRFAKCCTPWHAAAAQTMSTVHPQVGGFSTADAALMTTGSSSRTDLVLCFQLEALSRASTPEVTHQWY
jgi:hypothetical protein